MGAVMPFAKGLDGLADTVLSLPTNTGEEDISVHRLLPWFQNSMRPAGACYQL